MPVITERDLGGAMTIQPEPPDSVAPVSSVAQAEAIAAEFEKEEAESLDTQQRGLFVNVGSPDIRQYFEAEQSRRDR